MSYRFTIALAVIAACIGGYLLYAQRTNSLHGGPEASARMLPWRSEHIIEFRIEMDYWTNIECKRTGEGEWTISGSIQTRANQPLVSELLFMLDDTRFLNHIDGPGEELLGLGEYGLDDPAIVFTVRTLRQSRTLLFGNRTPVGDGRYALRKEEGLVAVVPLSVVALLGRDIEDWKEPKSVDSTTKNL